MFSKNDGGSYFCSIDLFIRYGVNLDWVLLSVSSITYKHLFVISDTHN